MDSTRDASGWRPLAARILWTVLIATALSALYELRTFRRHVLFLDRLDLHWVDTALCFLSLWARTLLWIALPGLIAIALVRQGRRRLGTVVGIGSLLLVTLWFVLDARLLRITGAHLHTYLGFALQEGGREWGGDTRPASVPLIRTALAAAGALAVECAIVFHVGRLPGLGWLRPRRLVVPALLMLLAPLILVVGRGQIHEPMAFEQLYETVAGPTFINDADAIHGAGTAAFGTCVDEAFARAGLLLESRERRPVDVVVDAQGAVPRATPHVVLFVLESFRHDAISPALMPRLSRWSRSGLVGQRHDSGSNRSEMGAYALLHGRLGVEHWARVRAKERAVPALLRLFGGAGYDTTLVASCEFTWQDMDSFFAAPPFDTVLTYAGTLSWPERDRASIASVRTTLAEAGERPQLMVVFLMSTHWSYEFPAEYGVQRDLPEVARWEARDSETVRAMRARYDTSLRFLDDEIGGLVEGLDPAKHLVVVTGDHGESFGEDDGLAHTTKLSDAQTRTPFAIVGRGFPAHERAEVSLHIDLLPTLGRWLYPKGLHLSGVDGVDLRAPPTQRDVVLLGLEAFGWELAVVRGDRRLLLDYARYTSRAPRMRVRGFADEHAFISRDLAQPAAEVAAWVDALEALLAPVRVAPR